MGMALSVLSLVTERSTGPGPRPFDTRGLIRAERDSDIYKYLVCYSPAPASPPTLHINTDPDDRSDNSPTSLNGLKRKR